MRKAVRALGSPRVRAVIVPSLDPYFGVCGEQQKVFYASDDFVAGAQLMRISKRHLERETRRQPAEADLVVVVSPALESTFRSQGYEPLLLPNGCDPEVFAATDQTPPAPTVGLPGPVAGFMGHLSDRIDPRDLDAIAERGHSLLLIGPGPRGGLGAELSRLVSRPNVQWTGPQDFDALPGYLRHIDVGLIPYTDTAFNHASFPLKALEYLAAGRPVLSTDIGALRWLREGRNIGLTPGPALSITDDDIVIADTPTRFADAAESLMHAGRDDEAISRRQAFAHAHSWDQRFAVLADALGLVAPDVTAGSPTP